MYLDRRHTEGRLFARCMNAMSTDVLNVTSPRRFARTADFIWQKKFELLYRALGT